MQLIRWFATVALLSLVVAVRGDGQTESKAPQKSVAKAMHENSNPDERVVGLLVNDRLPNQETKSAGKVPSLNTLLDPVARLTDAGLRDENQFNMMKLMGQLSAGKTL